MVIEKKITVEESANNLSRFIRQNTGKHLNYHEMLSVIEECQSELEKAKSTGATELIKAWGDMLESLETQHRAGMSGILTI